MGRDIPKQYIKVCGTTLFEYTLNSVLKWDGMDSLQVVADPAYHKELGSVIGKFISDEISFLGFSSPGENRQGSIINALSDLAPRLQSDSVIMIHDAVRPLVSKELLDECDRKMKSADGVMPYLPMKDTVYVSRGSGKDLLIDRNIDRDTLVAGQTPEFYIFEKYKKCCDALSKSDVMMIHGSTEPAVMGGLRIALVPGDEGNFKITTQNDLERFEETCRK